MLTRRPCAVVCVVGAILPRVVVGLEGEHPAVLGVGGAEVTVTGGPAASGLAHFLMYGTGLSIHPVAKAMMIQERVDIVS